MWTRKIRGKGPAVRRKSGVFSALYTCRTRQFAQSKRWVKYAGDATWPACPCKESLKLDYSANQMVPRPSCTVTVLVLTKPFFDLAHRATELTFFVGNSVHGVSYNRALPSYATRMSYTYWIVWKKIHTYT